MGEIKPVKHHLEQMFTASNSVTPHCFQTKLLNLDKCRHSFVSGRWVEVHLWGFASEVSVSSVRCATSTVLTESGQVLKRRVDQIRRRELRLWLNHQLWCQNKYHHPLHLSVQQPLWWTLTVIDLKWRVSPVLLGRYHKHHVWGTLLERGVLQTTIDPKYMAKTEKCIG